ncbi:nitronate monooxygenase [Erythrobacter sp. SCSIO 43205]|uniref:NAD(P)H-dependent flavin oxidoreductase n=1 Tax=Erythrobacter sp. SCSIO 43205 TaxID=2779361 RepID=UPI001CA9CF8E|nr:nitronate monooxygenase [Erythrobacter sp. SCSIO 43205]UAB78610.1 nitronate monooxygenase [Erythrobacter sp. SCSIO 43205]
MADRLSDSRFARRFGLSTPIALAPMAFGTGGALATTCAKAGALALIGGAYGDLEFTSTQYSAAEEALCDTPEALARLGCGFITWRLEEDSSALDWLLDREAKPAAIMLSFGDPTALAKRIIAADIALICQVQTLAMAREAVEAGASVIVAQGAEAGGHGMNALDGRSTFTLVPEIADYLAAKAPHVQLLAAGGIADGRGLAAALMLGADGALVGSRLWASAESLAPEAAIAQAVAADGDSTARSKVFDILREKNWPAHFDFRALRNGIHREWEGRLDELGADPAGAIANYKAGVEARDYSRAHVTVGEGTGLIKDAPSAGEIIAAIDAEARVLLQ